MKKRLTRFLLTCMMLFFIISVSLGIITNISTHVTSSDESIFRSVLGLQQPTSDLTFEEEIELITTVQQRILHEAPIGPPIPDYSEREPEDLLRHRSGLCYDRSRTYDKLLSWLGFKVRHVYILYSEHPHSKEKLPYWKAFFTRGTASHAVTEVKTKRGWLLIDSNSDWISITRNGLPIDADHIPERIADFRDPVPPYFDRSYLAIRGLYSRRGQLYRPYLPYPQLNWKDFIFWSLKMD